MPLIAVDFVPGGPIKAADLNQFYNLFTGVMLDQPVTFANTLEVGGSHAVGSVPLRVEGVAAQTANLAELRTLKADVNPVFSIDKFGKISWGPGGGAGVDVTLARTGLNTLTLTGNLSITGTPALTLSDPKITGQTYAGIVTQVLPAVATSNGLWRFFKALGGALTINPQPTEIIVAPGATAASAAGVGYTSPNGESTGWFCNGVNWTCY